MESAMAPGKSSVTVAWRSGHRSAKVPAISSSRRQNRGLVLVVLLGGFGQTQGASTRVNLQTDAAKMLPQRPQMPST